MQSIIRRFLILSALLVSVTAFAEQYAVLIGIEAYPNLPKQAGQNVALPGPSNDVKHMTSMLIDRFGFDRANIRTIQDSGATHDGIEAAVRDWLTGRAKQGDTALVFFSGHGTQVKDVNGDEPDGLDEAFVCNDIDDKRFAAKQLVLDDELAEWVSAMSVKGVEVVLITDCCHSGTISRDFTGSAISKFLHLSNTNSARLQKELKADARISKSTGEAGAKTTLIAACRDDQTASTASFPRTGWMGALTYNLTRLMDRPGYAPTYSQLAQDLQKNITVSFDQVPQVSAADAQEHFLQFETSVSVTTSQPVITQPIPVPPVTAPVVSEQSDKLLVFIQGFGAETNGIGNAINSTAYAAVASSASSADRMLIRSQGSSLSAGLHMRDGRMEDSATAASATDLIAKLRPALIKACVLKRLATLKDSDASLQPEVVIDCPQEKNISVRPTTLASLSRTVKVGTKTVFKVRVQKACYVTLVDLPSGGPLTVLVPNRYQESHIRVNPNEWYSIPSASMTFDIVAREPLGRSIIIAIASTEPLDLSSLKLSELDGMGGMSESSDVEAGARVFRVESRPGTDSVLSRGGFAVAYAIAEVIR